MKISNHFSDSSVRIKNYGTTKFYKYCAFTLGLAGVGVLSVHLLDEAKLGSRSIELAPLTKSIEELRLYTEDISSATYVDDFGISHFTSEGKSTGLELLANVFDDLEYTSFSSDAKIHVIDPVKLYVTSSQNFVEYNRPVEFSSDSTTITNRLSALVKSERKGPFINNLGMVLGILAPVIGGFLYLRHGLNVSMTEGRLRKSQKQIDKSPVAKQWNYVLDNFEVFNLDELGELDTVVSNLDDDAVADDLIKYTLEPGFKRYFSISDTASVQELLKGNRYLPSLETFMEPGRTTDDSD